MKILVFVFSVFFFVSCSRESRSSVESAVDNTDSSIKSAFESGRYDDNMIDKIYSEMIKKDKKLSNLDDRVLKTYEKQRKTMEEYNNVLFKSESYYSDANYQTNTIKDSLLKHEIENKTRMSSEKYDLKIKNIKTLISKITGNTERMNDYYTIFKITKTLPEIEKYQNAHPLKTDSLENFIKKQNLLLNELKTLK